MARRSKNIPSIEKFSKLLRDNGLKATPQRLAVHRAMMKLEHACAEDVYEAVAREGVIRMSKSSVYNTLSQLSDNQVYSRLLSAGSKMCFDAINDKHIHLYDIRNDAFANVLDDDLMQLVQEKLKKRRFKGYKIECADINIVCRPTKTNKFKI